MTAATVQPSPIVTVTAAPDHEKEMSISPSDSHKTATEPLSTGACLPSQLPRHVFPTWPQIKTEDADLKTPLTPPSVYTDFLKALSPALSTPASGLSMRSEFSFGKESILLSPITQPSTATSTTFRMDLRSPKVVLPSITSAPMVPPSPFIKVEPKRSGSGRATSNLERLQIPKSATFMSSPMCASPAMNSAIPRTPFSAHSVRSPFSPTLWQTEGKTRYFENNDTKAKKGQTTVCIKQVTTKTVMYRTPCTPVGPVPKGKRRKMGE